jgi:hypothetical protein
MRAGTEAALARVVRVFGAARPHHAYLFANRRVDRMKVLVHDGIGMWLSARGLHQGKFHAALQDDDAEGAYPVSHGSDTDVAGTGERASADPLRQARTPTSCKRVSRRRHAAELKRQVLVASAEPGSWLR